jgi:DNA transposition AAA+ family ATPase
MSEIEKLEDDLYHARIKQKDVARKAGVSQQMVSLVLKGGATSKNVVDSALKLIKEKNEKTKKAEKVPK